MPPPFIDGRIGFEILRISSAAGFVRAIPAASLDIFFIAYKNLLNIRKVPIFYRFRQRQYALPRAPWEVRA
jgi:uncharacterized membrane protein YcjF (UPF0283 family)